MTPDHRNTCVRTFGSVGADANRPGRGGHVATKPEPARACSEHGTIYAISSDFGDRMTTQSMKLIVLLSGHF